MDRLVVCPQLSWWVYGVPLSIRIRWVRFITRSGSGALPLTCWLGLFDVDSADRIGTFIRGPGWILFGPARPGTTVRWFMIGIAISMNFGMTPGNFANYRDCCACCRDFRPAGRKRILCRRHAVFPLAHEKRPVPVWLFVISEAAVGVGEDS